MLNEAVGIARDALNHNFEANQNQLDRDQELFLASNKIRLQTEDMLNAGLNPASLGGTAAEGNKAGASSAAAAALPRAYLGDAVQASATSALKASLLSKFSVSANRASSATAAVASIKKETDAIQRVLRSRKR